MTTPSKLHVLTGTVVAQGYNYADNYTVVSCPEAELEHHRTMFLSPRQLEYAVGDRVRLVYESTSRWGRWRILGLATEFKGE